MIRRWLFTEICDRADREPMVTCVVGRRVDVEIVEFEVIGEAGTFERTRPIVAVQTMVVAVTVDAVARSREEDSVAVRSFDKETVSTKVIIGPP